MFTYSFVKTVHILSASILLGGGLLIAFVMWMGLRSGDLKESIFTSTLVVKADFGFTATAVLIQAVSGGFLLELSGLSWRVFWIQWSVYLFLFIGACWLPVLFIQYRIRTLLVMQRHIEQVDRERTIRRLFNIWQCLGWPAFAALIAIFFLMVGKYNG